MSLRIVDIIFDLLGVDPTTPSDGQVWYNSTENRHKVRQNGSTYGVSRKEELDAHAGEVNPHGTTLEAARAAGDTLSGNINMGGYRILSVGVDTNPASVATVGQVDDKIKAYNQGLDFQNSVLDKDILDPTPLSPTTGDRYLINGTGVGVWAGHDNEIAEWNGASWDYTVPTEGTTVRVEDENKNYQFDGTSWGLWDITQDHQQIVNRGTDDAHSQYLLRNGNNAMAADLDMGGNDIVNVGLVDGVDVSAHSGRHISGGTDELDGDKVDIDWNPSNYTPDDSPTEVATVDELTAHLKGIDTALSKKKAGRVLAAAFADNPKTATVTFGTSYPDTNYSVQLTVEGTSAFVPRVESKVSGGFVINMGANNITGLVLVGWLAIPDGEF